MRTVALGDVCQVTTGQSAPQHADAFGSSGTPFVRAGSLALLCDGGSEGSLELVAPDQASKYRLKKFPKDTVVFAKSGMSAKVGRVYRLRRDCHVVSHLAAVLPSKEIDSSYLHRWLEYSPPSRLIDNDAYPSIKTSTLEKIELPLPTLSEQRRIAAILDKADTLRGKRREAIVKVDQLLQSVFLDMFGDPANNSKGWPTCDISLACDFLTGYPFKSEKYVPANKGIKLCRGANVLPSTLDWSDEVNWPIEAAGDVERFRIAQGDVLVAMDRPWISTGFKIVLVSAEDPECLLVQRVARLRAKAHFPPSFIYALFSSEAFKRHCRPTETTVPHISPNDFRSFQILDPGKDRLRKFESIAGVVSSQMQNCVRWANIAEAQFLSIQKKAFTGGL